MKPTRILTAAAIVLLAAACDTGGTKITAPDQARYDGGNYFGSGSRNSSVGSTVAGTDGTNTMGSGGSAYTTGSASDTTLSAETNGTNAVAGTGMFGSGH